jgi:hypothetical protein
MSESSQSPLAQDLLRGVAEIATYTGEPQRRVRHLIRAHDFPHFKRGAIIYSRRSWADRWYSGETVATNGGDQK